MFRLSMQDIHLDQQAGNKEEAIRQVVAVLVSTDNMADGYVNSMLAREQQTLTFLGNGIVIPYSMTNTHDQMLKTDVQVFQFPQGVIWDEGQTAYAAIGATASSDEYLGLLRQPTHVLSDDAVATQLQSATTAGELRALLMEEKQSKASKLDDETLSLDVTASDLLTLQMLSVARLKEVGAVDVVFVGHAISNTPLNLDQGVRLNDSMEGNLRNTVAVSRVASAFTCSDQPVSLLVTVAVAGEQPTAVLSHLSKLLLDKEADRLLKADVVTVLMLLISDDAIAEDVLSAEFMVHNEHGLHARPGVILANTIKQFSSDITVTDLDDSGRPVNGRNLMKVVALGTKRSHHLHFTAQGENARQALNAIGEAITAGLREGA